MVQSVTATAIPGLDLFRRGKVRDTYHVPQAGGDRLLMVASDRL